MSRATKATLFTAAVALIGQLLMSSWLVEGDLLSAVLAAELAVPAAAVALYLLRAVLLATLAYLAYRLAARGLGTSRAP